MSLMKSLVETVAHFLPDPKRDPLIDHDMASLASRSTVWMPKPRSRARPVSPPSSKSATLRTPPLSTAPSPRARSPASTPTEAKRANGRH